MIRPPCIVVRTCRILINMKAIAVFVSFVVLLAPAHSRNDTLTIKIGGLFSDHTVSRHVPRVFAAAVDFVNSRTDILPDVNLTYVLEFVPNVYTSLDFIQAACSMASDQVAAVIGPSDSPTVKIVHPVFAALGIPQISPTATDPFLSIDTEPWPYLFKMVAPDTIQSKAMIDVMLSLDWQSFSVVAAASSYGYDGIKEIGTHASRSNMTLLSIGYYNTRLPNLENQIRQILIEIKVKGARVTLIIGQSDEARLILDLAYKEGMTGKGWAWIVSDGVTMGDDLFPECGPVPYYQRGLLGLRVPDGMGALYGDYYRWLNDANVADEPYSMLVFDSVLAAAYGLHDYLQDNHDYVQESLPHSVCLDQPVAISKQNRLLKDYVENVSKEGVTNRITFTKVNYVPTEGYNIVNLQRLGWKQVGIWKAGEEDFSKAVDINLDNVLFSGSVREVPDDVVILMENMTFRIVTLLEEPYVMLHNSTSEGLGYTGYLIDFLLRIQDELKFKFHIHLVKDGSYGSFDPVTGTWNGMIEELVSGKADIALAPLTINYERSNVVDFTKSFQETGTTILMATPQQKTNYLSFFDPFSVKLWIVVVVACIVCGIMNTLASWGSPFGNRGRYSSQLRRRGKPRHTEHRNDFNLWNSLWYSFSQWMQQGAEESSKSFSGRMVYGVWYFAVMVITATYTANLAAFLTVKRMDTGINSVDDLAAQTEIKYGTVKNSAVESFFRSTTVNPYDIMNTEMLRQDLNVQNASEGIRRVRESVGKRRSEQYAFIFDDPLLQYASAEPPCEIGIVGQHFNPYGLGVAFQKNSPYVRKFSIQILKLKNSGYLDNIEKKWFKQGVCSLNGEDSDADPDTQQASLSDMAGVFLVMLVGFVLVFPIVAFEFCLAARDDIRDVYRKKGERLSFSASVRRRRLAIAKDIRENVGVCLGAPDPSSESSDGEERTTTPQPRTATTSVSGSKVSVNSQMSPWC